jgi:putative two-component system response regulator
MRQHPAAGEGICAPLKSFRLVLPIIRHHHEKLDGSGYPDGLKGDQIPLTARIMTVVDVYDAFTTDRPYRCASSTEKALELMEQEVQKGWWDPNIFSEFRNLLTTSGGKSPSGGN